MLSAAASSASASHRLRWCISQFVAASGGLCGRCLPRWSRRKARTPLACTESVRSGTVRHVHRPHRHRCHAPRCGQIQSVGLPANRSILIDLYPFRGALREHLASASNSELGITLSIPVLLHCRRWRWANDDYARSRISPGSGETLQADAARRAEAQSLLDDVLLDDETRTQREAESRARIDALNALPQRKTRGDGTMYKTNTPMVGALRCLSSGTKGSFLSPPVCGDFNVRSALRSARLGLITPTRRAAVIDTGRAMRI